MSATSEVLSSGIIEYNMHRAVMEKIHVPEERDQIPNVIVIAGPCRTSTGALSTLLARSETVRAAHIQPIKTMRRSVYGAATANETHFERDELLLEPGNHVEVVKETFGPRNDAEYFNPLEILLRSGVPADNMTLIATVRNPLETFDSQVAMWGPDAIKPGALNRQFVLTDHLVRWAKARGITAIPYANELLRDNPNQFVVDRLFAAAGLPDAGNLAEWADTPGYERTVTYEIPPMKFIQGAVSRERGGRGGFKWHPHTYVMDDARQAEVQGQLSLAQDVYQHLFAESQAKLGFAVR